MNRFCIKGFIVNLSGTADRIRLKYNILGTFLFPLFILRWQNGHSRRRNSRIIVENIV